MNVARPSTISLRALNRATLARQLLLTRHSMKPVAAIERLAGMQAQVPRPPFVGLWSRLEAFKRDDLVRAIERREVVRSTLMRATIHLVSRRDFLAWRTPLQPALTRGVQSLFGKQLVDVDVDALIDSARRRFETDPSTFAYLRSHLKERFPALDERLMGYVVRMQLPLVQTPAPGAEWAYPANASFTVAEGWLADVPSADTSLDSLALRYLAAFGPATSRDFQTWSGVQGGRELLDRLRDRLVAFTADDGRELFDVPKAPRPDSDVAAPVRFLPEYDNLLLAFDDRRRIIDPVHRTHLISKNLTIPATMLVDGMVAGSWKVERTKKEARLQMTPFGAMARRTRQALADEGEALLAFLEPNTPSRAVSFVGR